MLSSLSQHELDCSNMQYNTFTLVQYILSINLVKSSFNLNNKKNADLRPLTYSLASVLFFKVEPSGHKKYSSVPSTVAKNILHDGKSLQAFSASIRLSNLVAEDMVFPSGYSQYVFSIES